MAQRILKGLRVVATNNDGTAYSKARLQLIIRSLENEGFTVQVKRKLTISLFGVEK